MLTKYPPLRKALLNPLCVHSYLHLTSEKTEVERGDSSREIHLGSDSAEVCLTLHPCRLSDDWMRTSRLHLPGPSLFCYLNEQSCFPLTVEPVFTLFPRRKEISPGDFKEHQPVPKKAGLCGASGPGGTAHTLWEQSCLHRLLTSHCHSYGQAHP